ncbi:hypothetical protein N9055_01210 [Akkermansiaceae bacterium]|nr:hypothetical protein [Akkermansiaceae bacterium]
MRLFIPIFISTIGILYADRVEWIGEGQVTSASGVFGADGIAVDDEVSMKFSYNDDAGFITTKEVFGETNRDFYENVELAMMVTIGERTWEGSVTTGVAGFPETIFVSTGFFKERFDPVLREAELAEFSSFPLDTEAGDNSMRMEFKGNDAVFLQSGIEVDSINPREIIVANGSITTGGTANILAFALDFDSIQVRTPGDELGEPVPFVLNVSAGETTVNLSWETELNVSYQLQEASGLEEADWTTIETISGTGDSVTRSRVRVEETRFYRLVRE